MSLGFLTESALLPSKAKAINVDSKSLLDLRAVVYQKEQERHERQRALHDPTAAAASSAAANDATNDASLGARGFGRFAHLRATKKRSGAASATHGDDRLGKSRNRGVEKRRQQDEAAREDERPPDDDDRAWHRKSRDMLAKKAKLYDAMARGDSSGAASVTSECLVDFRAKQRVRANGDSGVVERVEITDEFGRTCSVAMHSAAHVAFIEQQQQQRAVAAATTSSTADPQQPMLTSRLPLVTSDTATTGSYVVAQWEQRLNAQEKTYLLDVHADADVAKSAVKLDATTRKQQRLEKLRQQQQRRAAAGASDAVVAPTVRDNSTNEAAAQQATAFLSQLGALQ